MNVKLKSIPENDWSWLYWQSLCRFQWLWKWGDATLRYLSLVMRIWSDSMLYRRSFVELYPDSLRRSAASIVRFRWKPARPAGIRFNYEDRYKYRNCSVRCHSDVSLLWLRMWFLDIRDKDILSTLYALRNCQPVVILISSSAMWAYRPNVKQVMMMIKWWRWRRSRTRIG